jgi:hypothetical protein
MATITNTDDITNTIDNTQEMKVKFDLEECLQRKKEYKKKYYLEKIKPFFQSNTVEGEMFRQKYRENAKKYNNTTRKERFATEEGKKHNNEKFTCELCLGQYSRVNKYHHNKSKKHQEALNNSMVNTKITPAMYFKIINNQITHIKLTPLPPTNSVSKQSLKKTSD